MPQIALHRDFMQVRDSLDKRVRKDVDRLLEKFSDAAHAKGVNLEPYINAADPRARTARVNDNFRAILCAAPDDTYIIFTVLTHDEADRWMARRRFHTNVLTGALEIMDIGAIDEIAPATAAPADALTGPLAHRSDKDLRQLGITDEHLVNVLRGVRSDEEVRAVAALLPPSQRQAVDLLLHPSDPVEEIYAVLADELAIKSEPVETTDRMRRGDVGARPQAGADWLVVDGAQELERVLTDDFAAWKVFLHPSQRAVAYKPRFNGPARITGGPGTGKTVALLHRARYLAEQLPDAAPPILVTTFTKQLASDLRRLLVQLAGDDVLEKVEVQHIDRIANEELRRARGGSLTIVQDEDRVWTQAVEAAPRFPVELIKGEYEHVVLVQGLRDKDSYLRVNRSGRGVRLDRRGRAEIWSAIERFEQLTRARKRFTFLQVLDEATSELVKSGIRPYSHVLIDEAQDFHPAGWRLVRQLVPEQPNDLFIAGDAHQRIYDRRVSLRSVGVNIVGRSSRLRINYRTTDEILRWSLQLLAGERFDDLDGGSDTLHGYRSEMHGEDPRIIECESDGQQATATADAIAQWLDAGVAPDEIAVLTRTHQIRQSVVSLLERDGIATADLGVGNVVQVGTMHSAKGLEYRAVVLYDISDGVVPNPYALTSPADDPAAQDEDIRRERCLLYVAASRAREQLLVTFAGTPSRFLTRATATSGAPT